MMVDDLNGIESGAFGDNDNDNHSRSRRDANNNNNYNHSNNRSRTNSGFNSISMALTNNNNNNNNSSSHSNSHSNSRSNSRSYSRSSMSLNNNNNNNSSSSNNSNSISKLLGITGNIEKILAKLGFSLIKRKNEWIVVDSSQTRYDNTSLKQLGINDLTKKSKWDELEYSDDKNGLNKLIFHTGNPCNFMSNMALSSLIDELNDNQWGEAIKQVKKEKREYEERQNKRVFDVDDSEIWLTREQCEEYFENYETNDEKSRMIHKSITNELFWNRVDKIRTIDLWEPSKLNEWKDDPNKRLFSGML